MKKYIFLMLALLMVQSSFSQVIEVITDIYGTFRFTVQINKDAYVVLNIYGEIIEADMPGRTEYYSGFRQYEAGKIKRIGNVEFSYYSDFHAYEAGKIKKIGPMEFTYYSDFWPHENGKIKKAGNVEFAYYSDFWPYENGKVKKIGSVSFAYYSDFWDYENGKIKTIGRTKYDYHSTSGSEGMVGKLKSGPESFVDGGITFFVQEPRPQHRRRRPGNRRNHTSEARPRNIIYYPGA